MIILMTYIIYHYICKYYISYIHKHIYDDTNDLKFKQQAV